MAYNTSMNDIYIKSTPQFDEIAEKLMSEQALEDFLNYIALHPESGKVISGTGGIRKIRWETGKNNRGKSGGVRILYHYSENLLVILITLYGKAKKEDISDAEKNAFKQQLPVLIDKYRGEIL